METDRTIMEKHICLLLPAPAMVYWNLELFDGSAKDYLIHFLSGVKNIKRYSIMYLASEQDVTQKLDWSWLDVPFEEFILPTYRWDGVLQNLITQNIQEDIYFLWADSPFNHQGITEELATLHKKYRADYTFADGFPQGTAPDILSPQILSSLYALAVQHTGIIDRSMLFGLIQKDINAYQIETLLAKNDFRPYRLELNTASRRGYLLCKSLAKKIQKTTIHEDSLKFEELLIDSQIEYRTLPAYLSLQITAQCPQICTYCPYPILNPNLLSDSRSMPLEQIKDIIQRFVQWAPESVISLSPLGEPSLHPNIYEIISYIDSQTPLKLVIETSGLGWDFNRIQQLFQKKLLKTQWIISLDAVTNEDYSSIRGKGFTEALDYATRMVAMDPTNVYIQAIRLKDRERELLDFYQYWEKRTKNIIIQKYYNQGGLLPQRKPVDLRPLKRLPCWHIKRDIMILLDGQVPRCHQDMSQEHQLGNIFEQDFNTIWNANDELYYQHCNSEYPDACGDCDEYYTYNF